MFLGIDTADKRVVVFLELKGKVVDIIKSRSKRNQAEIVLKKIDVLLGRNKLSLKDIKGVKVQDHGEGFTSLRVGIVTANTLAYALSVPIKTLDAGEATLIGDLSVVQPKYDKEPNITMKKSWEQKTC